MGVVLTIDQGNSSIKYSVFDAEGQLVRGQTGVQPDLDAVEALLAGLQVEGGIYASVGRFDVRFAESLRLLCSDQLLVFTPSTPVPLKNNYATPLTLGADRLAAAVGAATIYPGTPLLIADAGSALTLDLLAPDASYCGGTISPGIAMRLNALHAYTERLPKTAWNPGQELTFFPCATSDAMVCGAVTGVVAQMQAALHAAAERYPGCRMLVTGGDAPTLLKTSLLDHLNPLYQPALVPIGLNRIFRYNETFT